VKLSIDEVRAAAQLARLGLSDAELEAMTGELSKILEYIDQINQLDTAAIPPTAQVGDLVSVMRDDIVAPSLSVEEALANAPDRDGPFFRVKAMQD
jgi:aspartyl-tRNA(Asn)/glutamyl-tRNA(Gln) amidotransferase subunit C